jgi:UDP-N-acetylglucosamine 2-epimerase (non-hydrolysing)
VACALVAAKLREQSWGAASAHVEAGSGAHDWRMPEEVNSVLTDRLSDLLLTDPSRRPRLPNLVRREGFPPSGWSSPAT